MATTNKTKSETVSKLKKYLLINTFLYAFGAIIILFFVESLTAFFNIKNRVVFTSFGIILLGFSFFVFYVSSKYITNKQLINAIIYFNIICVAGSIIIAFFGLFDLTDQGYLAIMGAALGIGFLAVKQSKYNKSEKIVENEN